MNLNEFREVVWQYAHEHHRSMPWRDDHRPYYVLVSELMLQQTQVDRVVPKFLAFIERFPDISTLASSPLGDVLQLWSGLGYNRRAKFLHHAAQIVASDLAGTIPDSKDQLMSLPGVGENTAGAILAYAFNQPVVYIETNIRTVYFHHFFQDETDIDDKVLKPLIEQTVDREHPREWYWALMDYGTHLKKQGVGRIRQSKHYTKQSPLKGSLREVRGMILKTLAQAEVESTALRQKMPQDARYEKALAALLKEGLVIQKDNTFSLY